MPNPWNNQTEEDLHGEDPQDTRRGRRKKRGGKRRRGRGQEESVSGSPFANQAGPDVPMGPSIPPGPPDELSRILGDIRDNSIRGYQEHGPGQGNYATDPNARTKYDLADFYIHGVDNNLPYDESELPAIERFIKRHGRRPTTPGDMRVMREQEQDYQQSQQQQITDQNVAQYGVASPELPPRQAGMGQYQMVDKPGAFTSPEDAADYVQRGPGKVYDVLPDGTELTLADIASQRDKDAAARGYVYVQNPETGEVERRLAAPNSAVVGEKQSQYMDYTDVNPNLIDKPTTAPGAPGRAGRREGLEAAGYEANSMPSAIDPNVSVTYYKPAERLEFDQETGQYKKRLRPPNEQESRNAPEHRPAPAPPLPPPPEPEAPTEPEAPQKVMKSSKRNSSPGYIPPTGSVGYIPQRQIEKIANESTEGAPSEELTPDPELAPAPAPLPEAGAKDKLNDYLRERALYRRANRAGMTPAEYREAHKSWGDTETGTGSLRSNIAGNAADRDAAEAIRAQEERDRKEALKRQRMGPGRREMYLQERLGDPDVSDWEKAIIAHQMMGPDGRSPIDVQIAGAGLNRDIINALARGTGLRNLLGIQDPEAMVMQQQIEQAERARLDAQATTIDDRYNDEEYTEDRQQEHYDILRNLGLTHQEALNHIYATQDQFYFVDGHKGFTPVDRGGYDNQPEE